MFLAFKIVLVLALIFVVIGYGANRLQRLLMYVPDTEHVSPQSAGLPSVEEITFQTPDGETIIAWWSPANPGQPTLLYFHGNAGALASRSDRLRLYQDAGFGMFMMSYRGYGGSSGGPSEQANVADGKQAYEVLRAAGVMADKIVVYGGIAWNRCRGAGGGREICRRGNPGCAIYVHGGAGGIALPYPAVAFFYD